ncbi:hypothetical protein [Photobacterium leiognathi]|uniref:hypothetical protein n=1 Tax=Photobacterium leiognathi TaxID=553611 RepID=UPI0029817D60|nr:hypothetical protein [Photobacterium leiognathi]
MTISITKKSVGQKYFVVPCGEMTKYHDTECGYAEMTFLTVGTKYVTITEYNNKDKEPNKRERKFSVRPNLPERNTIGFQDQMCLLMGSYDWSCYVFEDEETCKAFVRKSALIEKIVDSINIYTLRDVLASKDTDTLKILDQIFNN